ncbi:hypothetical protein LSUE1_G005444 [Lachnellula suecica]|uniref:Xylanolytic transcriptional activator regulatory domain-containing protein n=1 Tax=Lachnellula suecica TaxID=602035 RepID=A0A8T9C5K8_9HELO|nr:hypothetical protein LSUE1_G005444 [Lachnellula suecica]
MDSASSATSSNPPPPTRAQRGAIATQRREMHSTTSMMIFRTPKPLDIASVKQKCDEQRPKCGLCSRMKLDCRYREPQPTKKDKTLVEILDYVKSIDGKFDRVLDGNLSRASSHQGFGPSQKSPSSQPSLTDAAEGSSFGSFLNRPSYQTNRVSTEEGWQYRHASAAHKMLTWPAIAQLLLQTAPSNVGDLNSLRDEGSAFVVRMQKGSTNLPLDEVLPDVPFIGMQTQASRVAGGVRTTFPTLTRERMQNLAKAYFDSFNFIYPFMDRQNFLSDTLTKVQTEGFDGDNESVIALLVFALGELAIEGYNGTSIERHHNRDSGVRGGTSTKPPGLALFNEARKKMGFVLTACDLENVQILSLAALYYACCSRHVEFWRMTVSASQSCHIVINCNTIDWDSPKGDLIQRAYWHCVLMETTLHLELDLPLTGITALERHVGLPSFEQPFCEADATANAQSHFKSHYSSQVALRRLCATLHNHINESTASSGDTPATSTDNFGGPSANTIKLLASQLTEWRGNLPDILQWAEDDPTTFPISQSRNTSGFAQSIDPKLASPSPETLFFTDLDKELLNFPYLYDIQVALLRTNYYYAKYIVYRPFVYKALHFPDLMTQEDAMGAAECLRSCLNWPLTMNPASRRKRLIPYLFCWSQNFLGILLIFHMSLHNEMLKKIRAQLCGPNFEAEVGISIELMLDWIRDLKSTDSIAMWCWKIVREIYPVGD